MKNTGKKKEESETFKTLLNNVIGQRTGHQEM